jgi:hypothetical protein
LFECAGDDNMTGEGVQHNIIGVTHVLDVAARESLESNADALPPAVEHGAAAVAGVDLRAVGI